MRRGQTDERHHRAALQAVLGTAISAATVTMFPSLARASGPTLYWDVDGSVTGNNTATGSHLGGSGTWDNLASPSWFGEGSSSDTVWIDAALPSAIFTGTPGTVTLNGTRTPASVTFMTPGYTITGAQIGSQSSTTAFDVECSDVTISSGAAGNATVTGPGVLRVRGSWYLGNLTIDGGTVDQDSVYRVGNPSGTITLTNGGTLRNSDASGIGGLAYGKIAISGAGALDVPFDNSYSQQILGPGTLTKTGTGRLVYNIGFTNGAGTFSKLIVKEGMWQAGNNANVYALGNPGGPAPDAITLDGGGISLGAGFPLSGNYGVTVAAGGGTIEARTSPLYIQSDITGPGNLTYAGLGTIALIGSKTYTGTTTITAGGTVIVPMDGSLGVAPSVPRADNLVFDGGTLRPSGSWTLSPNRGITLGAAGGTFDLQSSALTYSGIIAGDGSLTQTSGGPLVLSGTANTYRGNTIINGGILQVFGSGSLGDGSATNNIIMGGGTNYSPGSTLQPMAPMTTSRSITIQPNSGGEVVTQGFDSTFGPVDGPTGLFFKVGGNTLTIQHARVLNLKVAQGRLVIAAGGTTAGVSSANSLTCSTGAYLDLRDNSLIDHTDGVGSYDGSAYNGVTGLIARARNGGTWDGPAGGIVTSMPDAIGSTALTTLGVAGASDALGLTGAQTATWSGQTVGATDTLVMFTYGGDANLDGVINIDDYGRIDANVGIAGASGWYNGDFNYDGAINIDDYGIIDGNIGVQGAPFSTGRALAGVLAVPEPACAGATVLMMLEVLTLRRRKRRMDG